MKKVLTAIVFCTALAATAQTTTEYPAVAPRPVGKVGVWEDTTRDSFEVRFGPSVLLFTERYVVNETHKVCASVQRYFLEKTQVGGVRPAVQGHENVGQLRVYDPVCRRAVRAEVLYPREPDRYTQRPPLASQLTLVLGERKPT